MESGHEACSCTACQASISGSEPAGSFLFFLFDFYFIFQFPVVFSASVSVYILAGTTSPTLLSLGLYSEKLPRAD